MSKHQQQINQEIEPVPNEPLRFFVPSDTYGQPPYEVDLGKYNGNGECPCIDFETRRLQALREGTPMGDFTTRCKHLRRARNYLLDREINRYIQERKAAAAVNGSRPYAPHNEDRGDY